MKRLVRLSFGNRSWALNESGSGPMLPSDSSWPSQKTPPKRRGSRKRSSIVLSLSPVLRGEGRGEGSQASELEAARFADERFSAPSPTPSPADPGEGGTDVN